MTRSSGLLAVAAAAALLAACGTPPPAAAPTTSRTPSTPAPSPTPSPPTGSTAPAGFVALSDVDPTILQDIRYATPHNFVGRPVAGYEEPTCVLTRTAAQALQRVQRAAVAQGYTLKMYDCYRPQRASDDFVAWSKDPSDTKMRAEFYPDLDKSRLFPDFIAARADHSHGQTVDLTLVKLPARTQPAFVPGQPLVACTAPAGQRFPDNSIDMGTGYDCFDPRSHTANAQGAMRDNRQRLVRLMNDAGFVNYAGEWWHYTLPGGASTFYDFPVTRAALPS
jgi:D-alanyl-D-alanine dipeptidase